VDASTLIGRDNEVRACASYLANPGSTLVVSGKPGVGKSAFAACVARTVSAEVGPELVRTSHAVLESLASLISQPLRGDRVLLESRSLLGGSQGTGGVLIFVDDAHTLAPDAAEVLFNVARRDGVRVVACVTTGAPAHATVTRLWTELGRRFELEALQPHDAAELAETRIGGPLSASARRALWEASRGNPARILNFITTGIQGGWLVDPSGIWEVQLPLDEIPTIALPARETIDALSPHGQFALWALALIGPVRVSELDTLAEPQLLEDLEQLGLITVTELGWHRRDSFQHSQRQVADFTQPFLRALAARMVDERHDAMVIRRRLIEFLGDHPEAVSHPRLRTALLGLQTQYQADDEALLNAAVTAEFLQEHDNALRLSAVLWDDSSCAEAEVGQILGMALYNFARFSEARDVLNAAVEAFTEATAESCQFMVRTVLANTCFWGLGLPEDAIAALAGPSVGLHEPYRTRLASAEASLLNYMGRPKDALAALKCLRDAGPNDVDRAEIESVAFAMTGRTEEAVLRADAGLAALLQLQTDELDTTPAALIIAKAFALTEAGRLDEAESMMMLGHEISGEHGTVIGELWTALALGRVALIRGRPATAWRWFSEAVVTGKSAMHLGLLRFALAGAGLAAYGTRDIASLRTALTAIDAIGPWTPMFLDSEIARFRAAAARLAGEHGEAESALRDAAQVCRKTGRVLFELEILHDLARGGAANDGDSTRAREIAENCDSALAAARAAHVVAAVNGEPGGLVDAAEQLAAVGATLNAAESFGQAALAFRGSGNSRSATAAERRAADLLCDCEGAKSSVLSRLQSPLPLSPRELEIIHLVRQGMSNRDIASRLVLSLRTVQNHVHRILQKTGAPDREALAGQTAPERGGLA